MKTRELIRQLQAADPSGDLEVTVVCHDIAAVRTSLQGYDGDHQSLELGEDGTILSARFLPSGVRLLEILPMSIRDALIDNPELPVETLSLGQVEDVALWRSVARKIEAEIERRRTAPA